MKSPENRAVPRALLKYMMNDSIDEAPARSESGTFSIILPPSGPPPMPKTAPRTAKLTTSMAMDISAL